MDKYAAEKKFYAQYAHQANQPPACIRPSCLPVGMRNPNQPPACNESTLNHLGEYQDPLPEECAQVIPRDEFDVVDMRHRAQSPPSYEETVGKPKKKTVKVKF